MVTRFAGCACAGQPSALDARQMFAHDIDFVDRRTRTQKRARDRLLVLERNALRGRNQVGRCAARHQHQHQIVLAGIIREVECAISAFKSCRRRGSDARPRSCARAARAYRNRDARRQHRSAARQQFAACRGNAPRRLGHRTRRLARCDQDQPTRRWWWQKRGRHDAGCAGCYRNAVEVCEKRAQGAIHDPVLAAPPSGKCAYSYRVTH